MCTSSLNIFNFPKSAKKQLNEKNTCWTCHFYWGFGCKSSMQLQYPRKKIQYLNICFAFFSGGGGGIFVNECRAAKNFLRKLRCKSSKNLTKVWNINSCPKKKKFWFHFMHLILLAYNPVPRTAWIGRDKSNGFIKTSLNYLHQKRA